MRGDSPRYLIDLRLEVVLPVSFFFSYLDCNLLTLLGFDWHSLDLLVISFVASLGVSAADDVASDVDGWFKRALRFFRELASELLSLLNLMLFEFALTILEVFEGTLVEDVSFTQKPAGVGYLRLERVDFAQLFIKGLVCSHLLFDTVRCVWIEAVYYFCLHVAVRHSTALHLLDLNNLLRFLVDLRLKQ